MADEKRIDRFAWTKENAPTILTNDDLQCRDCIYRTEPDMMECVKYLEKPGYVMYNTGKSCKYYQKK